MDPSSTSCPVCRAQGSSLRQIEPIAFDATPPGQSVSIRICDSCDFAWQWPLARDSDASKDYFRSEYEQSRPEGYFDKEQRAKIARMQLDFLEELTGPDRTLLDLGCGDGTFAIHAARSGWETVGLDPAMPIVPSGADDVANLTLRASTIDTLDPLARFSIVTLWDVVEHLPAPGEVLAEAWQRVRPGGWLVLETGNFQSADRLLAGGNWWAWQFDHRWYFSPPTLLKLLETFGYVEKRLADRVLRPWAPTKRGPSAPSRLQTIKSVLKRPWRLPAILAEHGAKRQAVARWPNWAGLPIFVIAVRKPY